MRITTVLVVFISIFLVGLVLGCTQQGTNGQSGHRCPATSWETDTPCRTNQPGGAAVSGIYVPLDCLCPSDTYDYEYNVQMNGEEYRTCVCLEE